MLIGKVNCELCGKEFIVIAHSHLIKAHGITMREYMDRFPEAPLYNKSIDKHDSKGLLLDALGRKWKEQ